MRDCILLGSGVSERVWWELIDFFLLTARATFHSSISAASASIWSISTTPWHVLSWILLVLSVCALKPTTQMSIMTKRFLMSFRLQIGSFSVRIANCVGCFDSKAMTSPEACWLWRNSPWFDQISLFSFDMMLKFQRISPLCPSSTKFRGVHLT